MNTGKVYALLSDNKGTLKLLGIGFAIVLLFSGYIQTMLINTLIFGYLSFNTMKFLKTANPEQHAPHMIELLKHWTCFTVLIVAEYFLSCVFSFLFMSLIYNTIKVAGLVLLLQNNVNLSLLYDQVLVRVFNKYEDSMTSAFGYLENKANSFREVSNNKETNYSLYYYVRPVADGATSFFSFLPFFKGTSPKADSPKTD